jgi:hypothetical protein
MGTAEGGHALHYAWQPNQQKESSMRRSQSVIGLIFVAVFANAGALTVAPPFTLDRTVEVSSDQLFVHHEYQPPGHMQVADRATESTKTTVKTKNDGTVITKETTKSNDGDGNTIKIKTKTTSSPETNSSPQHGGVGASYEGE